MSPHPAERASGNSPRPGNSPRGGDKFEESGEIGDTIQQWLTSQAKHTTELSEKLTHSGRGFNTAATAPSAQGPEERNSPTGSEGDGGGVLRHDDVPIQTFGE